MSSIAVKHDCTKCIWSGEGSCIGGKDVCNTFFPEDGVQENGLEIGSMFKSVEIKCTPDKNAPKVYVQEPKPENHKRYSYSSFVKPEEVLETTDWVDEKGKYGVRGKKYEIKKISS